ncbi:MAG TPA: SCO family protein, partial [Spirochaetia bacterium]|nr:SCO family protein [Spirochaetia bacterium]
KGNVVLMTFIYTHCTDLCPFIALKVKDAYQLLGADAKNVVLVAVTTDPKRDIPQVNAAYSRAVGLFDAWHFVTGAPDAVHAVWASYGIGVTVDSGTDAAAPAKTVNQASPAEEEPEPTQGLSSSDLDTAGSIIQAFGGGYDVAHSAPFWIVDKKGMIRLEMDANATPTDIVTNLREMLRQR